MAAQWINQISSLDPLAPVALVAILVLLVLPRCEELARGPAILLFRLAKSISWVSGAEVLIFFNPKRAHQHDVHQQDAVQAEQCTAPNR